jgi:hypothetical protein
MERAKWTDDRIDERMAAIDEKFDRQLAELRALREEMRSGFSQLRAEMGTLRQRVDAGFSEQHHEMLAFHRQMLFIIAGFVVALIGLLGVVVAQV